MDSVGISRVSPPSSSAALPRLTALPRALLRGHRLRRVARGWAGSAAATQWHTVLHTRNKISKLTLTERDIPICGEIEASDVMTYSEAWRKMIKQWVYWEQVEVLTKGYDGDHWAFFNVRENINQGLGGRYKIPFGNDRPSCCYQNEERWLKLGRGAHLLIRSTFDLCNSLARR